MTHPSRPFLILYASETGTAQDVSERIAREARRRWFSPTVLSMDEYDRSQLIDEPIVIFVCSTTGQGAEPATMTRFWKFLLRKSHPQNILSHTCVAVFGLGDSSYPKFNFPAKKLYKRLVAGLGAQPILERGDGDDQHYLGLDGALDPWLEELWTKVMQMFPLPPGKEIVSADIVPLPSFEISFGDDEAQQLDGLGDMSFAAMGFKANGSASAKPAAQLSAVVRVNRRLTAPDHFQDVRHFELALDPNIPLPSHHPGDILVVHPQNLPDEVAAVVAHFGWTEIADTPFTLRPTSPDIRVPAQYQTPLTIRRLFTKHLDIFGRPRRHFFHLLSFFTTDPLHAEKLRELASPQGQQELYSYAHRPRRTMFEVLQDFHSAKVPLKHLLDLIPPIRPRSFSIASSPTARPGQIDLCVAIVEYSTKLKAPRAGVCTKWMKRLQAGDVVRCGIKRGTLRLPPMAPPHGNGIGGGDVDAQSRPPPPPPVVCVGPGTGVAPMRALLQERIARGARDNILVFGSRYEQADFLYADEWRAAAADGVLTLITAFSRDQEDKIYVQHRIAENSAQIYDAIAVRHGYFLLSGNASRMPVDVTAALVECVEREAPTTREEAERVVAGWEKDGRFQMECWS
ncbi:NADPH-dependent diflavin oxidoreductase 1 [Geranomyces michiganensis]|nr:NADPH-dependent diflavin oxidoreductase 1 [Geranomyces michiganensis]